MRPSESTGDLFDGLVQALARAEALPELTSGGDTVDYLAARLRQNPDAADLLISPLLGGVEYAALKNDQEMLRRAAEESLHEGRPRDQEFYEDSLRKLSRKVARLVLVVDQFEEIFTIAQTLDATGSRNDFVSALATLARSGRVWVIVQSCAYPKALFQNLAGVLSFCRVLGLKCATRLAPLIRLLTRCRSIRCGI